jgi:general secretion pathway protein G
MTSQSRLYPTLKPARARRAFTLIEVMIVIAIVLALMGIVGVAVFGQRDRAKADIAKMDLGNIQQALKMFNINHGRYPTDEEGLEVLWNKDKLAPDADASRWTKTLEGELAKDRWGSALGYRQRSEHGDETIYDLWSNGADGQSGTEDDIVSWKKDSSENPGRSSSSEAPPPPPGG